MSGPLVAALILLAGVLAFGGSYLLSAIFGERKKRSWNR